MSFELKYVKYKSKYLALKHQLNINNKFLQNGGSTFNNLDEIDYLSQTSNLKSQYNNYLSGGKSDSDKSDSEKSASEKSASEKSASEKSASEKSASEKSASEKSASEKSASEKSASEKSETYQKAGYNYSKVKSNKKYFFNDSDVDTDSTTTNSELSSLDTYSTDDSDI